MNRILFLIFFSAIVNLLSAQNLSLKGKIIDNNSLLPVENANITLTNNLFTTSNRNGEFFFPDLAEGNYQLKLTHINYLSETLNVKLTGDTSLSFRLVQKYIRLDDITVTSGKYEQTQNNLTYSAIILTTPEIIKNPAASVPELLKNEPGLSLIRDGAWGSEISIRGMNRSNIVTLIDGNRIETATDLSARLSMFDISDIERIEVIKGAASSLYGSGATGGMINIISKKGRYEENLYLRGSVNSGFNSVNSNFSNGLSLFAGNNFFHSKILVSHRKAGSTQTPSSELKNSQFEDYSFSASAAIKTFSNHEFMIDFQQFKAVNAGIPGAYGVFPENASVRYPVEFRKMVSTEYRMNNLSKYLSRLSLKYFHQFIYRDVENLPNTVQNVLNPPRKISVLEISPSADHTTDGIQAQANLTTEKVHYIIAGIDLWRRKYSGERTKNQKIEILDPATRAVINTINKTIVEKPLPDASFSNAGFYIQDEMQFKDKNLRIIVGARYDFINIKNDETKSPLYEINNGVINYNPANQATLWKKTSSENESFVSNLGIIYSPSQTLSIALNASRSFRSPSLEERFQFIDLGNIIRIGSPYLKPEKGTFADAGLRIKNEILRINGSVFLNYLNDLVSEVPSVYEGRNALIKTNIGKAILYGFDMDFSVSLFSEFTIYGNTSYVRGENINDKTNLPQIAPLNGLAGVRTNIIKEAEIDLSGVFVHNQFKVAPGELATKGYSYFNLSLNSEKIFTGMFDFTVSAGIENIFNREYRDHLSTSRGIIKSEPGRNFYLKLNLNW